MVLRYGDWITLVEELLFHRTTTEILNSMELFKDRTKMMTVLDLYSVMRIRDIFTSLLQPATGVHMVSTSKNIYRYVLIFKHLLIVNETKPWRLVKVESETAATTNDMMKAIQSGEDTPGQTEVLYRSDIQGWHKDSIYSMSINYQPSINTLEIMVKKDSQDLWSKLWDKTFLQSKTIGKVGMFAHSQFVRFYDSTIKEECVI